MAVIPNAVIDHNLEELAAGKGWVLKHRGKVRDTFVNPIHPTEMITVASDRISIFDFVLPTLIPGKGEYLTALTTWWARWSRLPSARHHLMHFDIPDCFPQERSIRVRRHPVLPVEMIFRMHLGGSVWEEYQRYGTAGGNKLPPNLKKWQKLPWPIFTPSTKEEVGHDINFSASEFFRTYGLKGGEIVNNLTYLVMSAYDKCLWKGITLLDTKFEVSQDGTLVDEFLTCDSSRFTTNEELKTALKEGRDPRPLDKQFVRTWGESIGDTGFFNSSGEEITSIRLLDPRNPEHTRFVHGLTVPQEIIEETIRRYNELWTTLTDQELKAYQVMRSNF